MSDAFRKSRRGAGCKVYFLAPLSFRFLLARRFPCETWLLGLPADGTYTDVTDSPQCAGYLASGRCLEDAEAGRDLCKRCGRREARGDQVREAIEPRPQCAGFTASGRCLEDAEAGRDLCKRCGRREDRGEDVRRPVRKRGRRLEAVQ